MHSCCSIQHDDPALISDGGRGRLPSQRGLTHSQRAGGLKASTEKRVTPNSGNSRIRIVQLLEDRVAGGSSEAKWVLRNDNISRGSQMSLACCAHLNRGRLLCVLVCSHVATSGMSRSIEISRCTCGSVSPGSSRDGVSHMQALQRIGLALQSRLRVDSILAQAVYPMRCLRRQRTHASTWLARRTKEPATTPGLS